jgi:hypothetical protein
MTISNLAKMSCDISMSHMTELAKRERDANFHHFVQNMGAQLRSANCPERRFMSGNIQDDFVYNEKNLLHVSDREQDIMQGLYITNKNCWYERPKINNHIWEKQFTTLLPDIKGFNIQTKSR